MLGFGPDRRGVRGPAVAPCELRSRYQLATRRRVAVAMCRWRLSRGDCHITEKGPFSAPAPSAVLSSWLGAVTVFSFQGGSVEGGCFTRMYLLCFFLNIEWWKKCLELNWGEEGRPHETRRRRQVRSTVVREANEFPCFLVCQNLLVSSTLCFSCVALGLVCVRGGRVFVGRWIYMLSWLGR